MPNNLYGLLSLLHLILWIIAVVDIVKSSKPLSMKIVWILIVLLLPVVGLILYFLLGRGK
ncbi:MAG: PLD nuclease N-terminal domain-containing protein [Phycisphaerales bacterium]